MKLLVSTVAIERKKIRKSEVNKEKVEISVIIIKWSTEAGNKRASASDQHY